jgi:hypothetical protein
VEGIVEYRSIARNKFERYNIYASWVRKTTISKDIPLLLDVCWDHHWEQHLSDITVGYLLFSDQSDRHLC